MSLRRQYSLPNCTLVLDGFASDGQPILNTLVNVECHFAGVPQKLHGGRTFLENLIQTVSAYAQSSLSGIPAVLPPQTEEERITLEPHPETCSHRLTWTPSADIALDPVVFDLSTVQLFDLVEAIDQCLGDRQTLPDLSLSLQPVPRRFRPPDEPLAQRIIPATIGLLSLAISAFALYWLPVPTIRKPDPNPIPQASPTETVPQPSPATTPPSPQPSP